MKLKVHENVKWIFSGIGVFIIGLILTLIFTRTSADKKEIEPSTVANITPIEIVDAVEAAPLLQQPEVSKHYYGLRVDWTGKLFSVIFDSKESVRLLIAVATWEAISTPRVCAVISINPNSYLGLGLLKRDDPVRVSGIIEEIFGTIIRLRDAKLISYGK